MPAIRHSANGEAMPLKQRRIIVLALPPVEELDLVGPIQVLSAANRLAGKSIYVVELVTNQRNLRVEGEAGLLSFQAASHYRSVRGDFNSLLIVCGLASRCGHDAALLSWIRRNASRANRVGSVCVGAFVLAEAGLLNKRRATSHWRFSSELAQRFPKVSVVQEPIWVRDGNIYTSAGISAGIDLALAWVEEDCGNAIATEIAREFVLFLRRPGGQAQLSVSLAAQAKEMKSIQELQVWIADNLQSQLSVPILAKRAAMSKRNFERVFTREVGESPGRYVAKMRVESAQRMLERTGMGLEEIADASGFASADVMRRAFKRITGRTPIERRRIMG
jgi:transcriptional regulator GlxA family with amidase domain